MKRRTPFRILLALGWYDHRLHRGIERYARDHGWSIRMDIARNRTVPWGWDGDGILAWLGADDELAEFVASAGKPTVDFSFRRPHLKFTRVLEDTAEAGRLVAGHFLSRGLQHFLYYSDGENWVYNERGTAFVEVLHSTGYEVRWLRWHQSPRFCKGSRSWKIKRRWLAGQLRGARRPVGVFAATDELAADVLDACEQEGISVPEEVAIMGAGDSLLAVNSMSTPISTVDTNLELLGYRGAQELDRLLHARRDTSPSRTLRIPPAGVIARKSSDVLAVNHAGVARSIRFLLENYREPIGVGKLARVAAMSKRAFQKAFVTSLGHGPAAEIERVRVEQARWLLRESSDKLSVIANECGYRSGNSFSVAFKRVTGLSPRDFRARYSAHD